MLNRRQLMGWLSATGIGTAAFHRPRPRPSSIPSQASEPDG